MEPHSQPQTAEPVVKPLKSRKVYTDSPDLHPNLLLASLQVLGWLFFHPSAWRNYIARIDSQLQPDFWLIELESKHWFNPQLRRLLLIACGIWPLLFGLFAGWFARGDEEFMSIISAVIAMSMINSVVFSPVMGITLGFASNVLLASSFSGFETAGYIIGLSMISAVPGNLIGHIGRRKREVTTIQQFGRGTIGCVMGVILTIIGAYIVFTVAGFLVSSIIGIPEVVTIVIGMMITGVIVIIGNWTVTLTSNITSTRVANILVSIPIVVLVLTYLISGTTTLKANLISIITQASATLEAGVSITSSMLISNIAIIAFSLRIRHLQRGILGGITLGFLAGILLATVPYTTVVITIYSFVASSLFAIPFALTERIVGTWAGAIAGALVFPAHLIIVAGNRTSLIIALSVLGGLSLSFWRPIVSYPLLIVWHGLIYLLDRQGTIPESTRLCYHAAFWDEHQRLRWVGLNKHLLLVYERDPVDALTAIDYLSKGRQRWAAQAAQIELDARHLERGDDARIIRHMHRYLTIGELQGPASALLRSFSRISQDIDAALGQESSYNQRLALSTAEDRLDGLIRELDRSDEKYAQRFRPIAVLWRQAVADHIRKLAEKIELHQEIDSPYIIGVPLIERQEIFVGREDIGKRIEQLLLDRRRPPLLLYGQRRMGKTSLLNNLGRLLPSTIVPLFVDLQGAPARASDFGGFLYTLAGEMVKSAADKRSVALPKLERATLEQDPFTVFDEWLNAVEQSLGDQTALLMLDEFEALASALQRGRYDEEDVLGLLRHLIQHRPKFKVLLAGSHSLEEYQRWASYLINVQVVPISYLKPDEARQLVEQPVQEFTLRYEPAASQRVLDFTRCHPFLVQLLCAEIVAWKNEQASSIRRLATLADVEAAVPRALQSGSFFFADIQRNQVDEAGRAVLQQIATQGEGGVVSQAVLAQRWPDTLDATLQLLMQRQLIEPAADGYCFQVELIRRWFADQRPIPASANARLTTA